MGEKKDAPGESAEEVVDSSRLAEEEIVVVAEEEGNALEPAARMKEGAHIVVEL